MIFVYEYSSLLRHSPDYNKNFSLAVEVLFTICDDGNADVRLAAEQCLNSVFRVMDRSCLCAAILSTLIACFSEFTDRRQCNESPRRTLSRVEAQWPVAIAASGASPVRRARPPYSTDQIEAILSGILRKENYFECFNIQTVCRPLGIVRRRDCATTGRSRPRRAR